MKRALLTIGMLALLAGCDNDSPKYYTKELSNEGFKNSGLADCKSFKAKPNSETGIIYVTRCPNSATTTRYPQGRTTETTVTIDGVEYIKKEQ